MEWLGYLAAVLMGLSLGIIGGGGSILTVPILVYFFRQDALVATTGSLFVVGTTALVGAVMCARRGLVDFKTGITFAIPSFAGVFFARRLLLPLVPSTVHILDLLTVTKPVLVLISFATLMILASRAMISSGHASVSPSPNRKKHSVLSVGLKGFLVGNMTGFVGAGGGFLIIPALVLLLKIPMRVAVGTSLTIIAANSLFGFFISAGTQATDWSLLLSIAILGVSGLILGQRVSSRFPERRLKQGFGYFVLTVGLFILVDQISKLT